MNEKPQPQTSKTKYLSLMQKSLLNVVIDEFHERLVQNNNFQAAILVTARIRNQREGNIFSRVCLSVCSLR